MNLGAITISTSSSRLRRTESHLRRQTLPKADREGQDRALDPTVPEDPLCRLNFSLVGPCDLHADEPKELRTDAGMLHFYQNAALSLGYLF
jgi:hypothetical protein